ncbi:ergothioneine biosynthesis protein EgtB [Vulgatibacter sp.]|uniref:ergothioneine biosynthesis protein EgtB n=1 Tax=Vulgatibacter sp. TaxID=1971226 RepID=UPI003566315C
MRAELRDALLSARATTERLTARLGDAQARAQFDPGFSPLGWHLGHVAWQEERWVLRRCAGERPIDPGLDGIYDSFHSHKGSRGRRLPPLVRIRSYAALVRERLLAFLERTDFEGDLLAGGWVFRFLANHERQHAETMAAALLLGHLQPELEVAPPVAASAGEGWCDFLPVEGGRFSLGCDDDPDGWDNERCAHEVELAPFAIARQPVTNGAFLAFLEAGGYRDDGLWSEAGRRWRDAEGVEAPLHWRRGAGCWERWTLGGWRPVDPSHPVSHLGWHEAEAFARWAGARLPTEAEWERAAGWEQGGRKRRFPWGDGAPAPGVNVALARGDTAPCGSEASPCGAEGMGGNVWEWTASPFLPWPRFEPGPYRGYSAPWFGDRHRVLRGGCWMSDPAMARTTFRNWFEPQVRAFPAGLRLARNR